MEISHLYEYVTLAKHMKLTSAAKELFLSPSTLSQHISAIESEMGTRLFDRKSTLVLTKDGEMALEHFQKIIEEYELVKAKCLKPDETEATFRVPSYFFGLDTYLKAKSAFQKKNPEYNIHFQTYEYQLRDPFEVLDEDLCDFVALYIVRDSGESVEDYVPDGIEYIRINTSRFTVVTSDKHPLSAKPRFTLDDLQDQVVLATLCRLTEMSVEGIKKRLQQVGVSITIRYKHVNRHEDMFGLEMNDEIIFLVEEWRELQHFAGFPHIVVHELAIELLQDTYLLYNPSALSKLQLLYIDTLRETAASNVIPFS